MQLANNDILKIDEVVQQPLEKCLLFLAFSSDKATTESLVHKEIMAKNRR
jgi:hypothetical protein